MTYYDIQELDQRARVKTILEGTLNRNDFFSARVALIPKKEAGDYRPICVINTPLRLLEKGLIQHLKRVKLNNEAEMFGFIAGKRTHDAYRVLKSHLE